MPSSTSPGTFIDLPCGSRSVAIYATTPGMSHRLLAKGPQVLVKFYRGEGADIATMYREYHGDLFRRCPVLVGNPHLQQSLEAGLWRGRFAYAILSYHEGISLRDVLAGSIPPAHARAVLLALFHNILIPLWSAQLRFRDLHAANFLVQDGNRIMMLDTEQLRKDVKEWLDTPQCWTQRDRHEALGLSRIPKLLHRFARCAGVTALTSAAIRRRLDDVGLFATLHGLGRNPGDGDGCSARAAAAANHIVDFAIPSE